MTQQMNPQALAAVMQQLQSMQMPYSNGIVLANRNAGQPNPALAKQVEQLVNPEVWTMYDTVLITPSTAPNLQNAVAYANFANVPQQIPMFNSRVIGNATYALTSMTTTSGYVDFPFKAYGVGVDVWCSTDAPSGANSQFTARQFIESVVYGCALVLNYSTDVKFTLPISDIPAGGGVFQGTATDTRAAAANQTAGGGTNGFPGVQSRVLWKDYILFKQKDTPFAVNLYFDPVAIHRINNLQALTGDFACGIRVKFWGYRGKQLVNGSPLRA